MQAVLCNAQLKNIKSKIKKQKYSKLLQKFKKINIKFYKFSNIETPWFVDIYVNIREELIKYLKSKNIMTRKVYPSISSRKYIKINSN